MHSDEIRSVHVCVGLQLKWMQSGHSLVWPRETSARQRHHRTRCVRIGGCTRLVQLLRLLHREELLT